MDSKELYIDVENESEFNIKKKIYFIRNQQVMMDNDLAVLYQVETGRLNEAVKRNIKRFPEGFRFQLTKNEYDSLISHFAISNTDSRNSARGGRRTMPYVYTDYTEENPKPKILNNFRELKH